MKENYLLRRRARDLLKGNWATAILMLIIYGAISSVSNVTVKVFSSDATASVDGLLVFILSLLVIPAGVGIRWTYLNLMRKQGFIIESIFEPYKKVFVKSILTSLLQGLFIFLWSLPIIILGVIGFVYNFTKFIDFALDGSGSGVPHSLLFKLIIYIFVFSLLLMVPAIIKGISYAQTMYILKDIPEVKSLEAITMSKKMMVGYKWKYFTLYLSFIGWAFLCVLTIGIGFLWLVPYVNATLAEFYNQLSREYFVSNGIPFEGQETADFTGIEESLVIEENNKIEE